MKGTVVHHEHRTGFIIIRDEIGEFAIAQLAEKYDVERGDILQGNLHSSGSETVLNETQNESMDVLVKGFGLTEQDAINMMLNPQ